MTSTFDLFTMGRSSIDLYANDVGAAFVDIKSSAAYIGGSPTNIAVGSQRLNIKTALLTVIGADPVGDFILNFLKQEGVETRFIPRKLGARRKPRREVTFYKGESVVSDGLHPGWFERMEPTFYQALDAFIKNVEGEETEYPTLMDGLKAQMIAEAAVESLQTNMPVKITYWQPEK